MVSEAGWPGCMICSNSGIEVTKYEQMLLVWYAMDYGIESVI